MIGRRERDLAGQMARAMMAVTLVCLTQSVLSFYMIYGLLYLTKANGPMSVSDLALSGYDLLALALAGITGLATASFVAVRLSRRITRPLRSVSRTARRIAVGDLEARARCDSDAPAEATALIDDFNAMAGRLEAIANAIMTWNAQIAHELRTPLTILNGRLQGVVDGVFVADERTMRGLLAQVGGLRRLVEDLRIVSLSDSGHLHLQLEEVDLAAEIEALIHLMEPELAAAGFSVDLRLDSGRCRIDVTRTRQAILALVDNARRYADPCELHIFLRLSSATVSLEIVDNGPGLPADFVPRAFDQFERADGAQDGRAGSGLGLSVVQAVARAHGGDVRYQHDAVGSAFILTFPRWNAEASQRGV